MRRARLPINQQAAHIANEKLRAQTGGKPIDPKSPSANALREQWMDAYVAAGGKVENVPPAQRPVGSPVQPCPLGYIELQYRHADATPVRGAGFDYAGQLNVPISYSHNAGTRQRCLRRW
jgi:hypothetical protein